MKPLVGLSVSHVQDNFGVVGRSLLSVLDQFALDQFALDIFPDTGNTSAGSISKNVVMYSQC